MAIRLARDTIESVQVKVTDDSQVVTDLSGTSPKFDVTEDDGTTAVVTAQDASAVDMTIFCLLDTTGWNPLIEDFLLWVYYTVGDETPRLGPYYITLS